MKKALLVIALISLGVVTLAVSFNPADFAANRLKRNDSLIAEQTAYHVGVLAYVYGYPLVDMYRQIHNETQRTSPAQQVYAPVNRFYRFPEIVGPDNAGNLRAPNNDTLYYAAWFDISEEPLILHTPDTDGRYYTIAVTNFYAEVEHIGRRTTGTSERLFALVLPGWQGELPDAVTPIEVETPQGWLLGRMLVEGPDDFDTAMGLVQQVWSASLSEFDPAGPPPDPEPQLATELSPMTSLGFFEIMNKVIRELPVRPGTEALMAQFDAIGVGPNSAFDQASLDPARKRGLERALYDGEALVAASTQRSTASYNGWMVSTQIGRYGFDYLQRASVVKGGYGNLPEESLYPAMVFDSDGQLMDGAAIYRLHFPAGSLPPVNGFWSLSVYRLTDYQLEENPIARYSLGDRTEGLQYAADGSLTLWLQNAEPAEGASNWLPTPAGNFLAVMRLYEPSESILSFEYTLPPIERLE